MVRVEYFNTHGREIQFAYHLQSDTWVCILTDQVVQSMRRYQPPLLDRNVDELELSVRASNCLRAEGIDTIRKLIAHKPYELLKLPNLGRTTLREIEVALSIVGLTLEDKVSV